MKPLRYIFGRVAVLDIRFRDDGTTEKRLFVSGRRGDAALADEYLYAAAKRYGAVAVCSGAGVVSRPLRGDAAETRIRSHGNEFVCNETDDGISFMRREAFAPIGDEAAREGIVLQRIYCGIAPAEAARRFRESVVWRDMLRIDDRGSALCRAAAKLIMLPVLTVYLIAAIAGTVLRSEYDGREQRLRQEYESLAAVRNTASKYSQEYNLLAAAFARRLPMKYSVLCDIVGGGVPEGVRLTALDVEPLAKRHKAGETLRRTERLVAIRGRCADPSSVGRFTGILSERGFAEKVELRSMAKTRDGDMEFEIDVRL